MKHYKKYICDNYGRIDGFGAILQSTRNGKYL